VGRRIREAIRIRRKSRYRCCRCCSIECSVFSQESCIACACSHYSSPSPTHTPQTEPLCDSLYEDIKKGAEFHTMAQAISACSVRV
jgi:hypothetical protein